jgi:hypothetical protein
MGIEKIKEVIQENREYFEKDPSMDHMNKFLFKLQEQKEEKKTDAMRWSANKWWIGMAASVSLLIGISWFIINHEISPKDNNQTNLTTELFEIKSYYHMETEKKLQKMNACAKKSPNTDRLLKSAESQLLKLDFNADMLEYKLQTASGNKKLELAYIQSLKAKNDLVSRVYEEICSSSHLLTQ